MATSTIVEHGRECLHLLEDLTAREETASPLVHDVAPSLKDHLGRLRVWIGCYGLGSVDTVTLLDDQLQTSQELAASILKLLRDLKDELSRVQTILDDPSRNRVELGGPLDQQPCSEVKELTTIISDTISELFAYSALAQYHPARPPTDSEPTPASCGTETQGPGEYLSQNGKTSQACPSCSDSTGSTLWEDEQTWRDQVYSLSTQTGADDVYSASYLRPFARWLSLGVLPADKSTHDPSSHGLDASSCAVLYDYGLDGREIRLSTPAELQNVAKDNVLRSEQSQLLFLRGYLTPQWACAVGAAFQVDPDFFYRHLNFCSDDEGMAGAPPLPSDMRSGMQLSMPCIARRSASSELQRELKRLRSEVSQWLAGHRSEIRNGRSVEGTSLVRGIDVLDHDNLAIDQRVSIWTNRTDKGWFALVWLDAGLNNPPRKPSRDSSFGTLWESISVIPYPFRPLSPKATLSRSMPQSLWDNRLRHNAMHLAQDYGHDLDLHTARSSSFYALSAVFRLCTASEHQFLNLLATMIDNTCEADDSLMIENFCHYKTLLDSHHHRLRQILNSIKNLDRWPLAEHCPASALDDGEAARRSLLQDFEHLLRLAKVLHARCEHGITSTMCRVNVIESGHAIAQAKTVSSLTYLAMLFAPLTFATSFFSMNLREVNKGSPLWLWFFVGTLLLFLSVAIVHPPSLQVLRPLLRLWPANLKVSEEREHNLPEAADSRTTFGLTLRRRQGRFKAGDIESL